SQDRSCGAISRTIASDATAESCILVHIDPVAPF
ncbi:MAG: hypothetical protein JWN34_1289, partial [Bryobacterales bacterium]|nr:hypothetical protein [Bryobacterales bacterium]